MGQGVDRPRDEETALRLLHYPDQFNRNRITSAAFKTRPPENPKYESKSLFVRERLPGSDGNVLHVGKFANDGRAALSFAVLRSLTYTASDGSVTPCGCDAVMSPDDCKPPLEAFRDAHATLTGPTHTPAVIARLAETFNNNLEKRPGPP